MRRITLVLGSSIGVLVIAVAVWMSTVSSARSGDGAGPQACTAPSASSAQNAPDTACGEADPDGRPGENKP